MVNHCKHGLTLLFSCTFANVEWFAHSVDCVSGWLRVVLVHVIDAHREAQLKHAIIIDFRLAALDVALDDHGRLAELRVSFRLHQLEQNVHLRLILMQRCPEVVSDDSLLAGLKLSLNVLLDVFVFLVHHEGLERPGHARLVLHGELKCDFAALDHLDIHEIVGDEHGHLRSILLIFGRQFN